MQKLLIEIDHPLGQEFSGITHPLDTFLSEAWDAGYNLASKEETNFPKDAPDKETFINNHIFEL